MSEIEKEPRKENEVWRAYCGRGWKAAWELVTDEGKLFVCNDHHFVLRQIHVVGMERQIGEEKWNKVLDFKEKDLEGKPSDDLGD